MNELAIIVAMIVFPPFGVTVLCIVGVLFLCGLVTKFIEDY